MENLKYRRLVFGSQLVGFYELLKEGTFRTTGAPEQLTAIGGTTGIVSAKTKGLEVNITVFVPAARAEYSVLQDCFDNDIELGITMYAGSDIYTAKGYVQEPDYQNDGLEMSVTIICSSYRRRKNPNP